VQIPTDTSLLADLVNAMNRAIDDGYQGVAQATDSPVFLLRQLAHAQRRSGDGLVLGVAGLGGHDDLAGVAAG
jgi:hypothetical protein